MTAYPIEIDSGSKDLVEQAATRPIQKYRQRTAVFMPWLKSYTSESQLIEDGLWEIILERLLINAVGVQLDMLGKIVGEPRFTTDDDEYRIAIYARIAINVSNGLWEDVYQVARLVLRSGSSEIDFEIVEYSTAIIIWALEELTNDPNIAVNYLWEARAAGVRIWLVYLPDVWTNCFEWAYDTELDDTAQGFAYNSATDPSNGGYLVGAVLGGS